jgi:hypothetical protein
MEAPKLELRKNKERLSRLAAVKLSAKNRTNRRIQLINDDLEEQRAKKLGLPSEKPKKESK